MTKRRPKEIKKASRGLLPSDEERKKWEDLGYRLPLDIARELDVARTTVYGWIARDLIQPIDDRPALHKAPSSGNVWVLLDAAKRLKPDPASIVNGSETK